MERQDISQDRSSENTKSKTPRHSLLCPQRLETLLLCSKPENPGFGHSLQSSRTVEFV